MRYYKNMKEFIKGKAVFVGIDVHLNSWNLCFYCDGEVIATMRINSKYAILQHALKIEFSNARVIRLIYEAGFSGFWLYRLLHKDGYDCTITPPNRIPKFNNKVKTDKRDAEALARLHASGNLKAIAIPSGKAESDRRLIRQRKKLSKKQTRQKNEIKSFLYLYNISKPEYIKSYWSKAYIHWLSELTFEFESDRYLLTQMLDHLKEIRQKLAQLTLRLRTLAKHSDYKKSFDHITKLKGVGLITAMTFILELFNIGRFKSDPKFSSYLGLTPSQFSSGEKVHMGRITREGNAYLRGVLIESAWTVIKHDPHLREKYNRIRAKGTNGNKAIVAVARSLAVRLRRCLLDDVDYEVGLC